VSVSSRLKTYCEGNKITQVSLINKGFGSAQTINNYLNGNTEPKANFLEKFIKEFRVSALWLMTGELENGYKTPDSIKKNGEDPIVTTSCPDCFDKQKLIEYLYKSLDDKDELLGMYRKKKENPSATGT